AVQREVCEQGPGLARRGQRHELAVPQYCKVAEEPELECRHRRTMDRRRRNYHARRRKNHAGSNGRYLAAAPRCWPIGTKRGVASWPDTTAFWRRSATRLS